MALKKDIILDNGIALTYHRIVSINKITNNKTLIEVGSYINDTQRQKEIDYYNTSDISELDMNIFIHTNYIEKEYNENDTIQDMYDYLKTLDKFKDAESI